MKAWILLCHWFNNIDNQNFIIISLNKRHAFYACRKFELAEKWGFEPQLGVTPLSVFKTNPFSRLGTSPWWSIGGLNTEPCDYKSHALTN